MSFRVYAFYVVNFLAHGLIFYRVFFSVLIHRKNDIFLWLKVCHLYLTRARFAEQRFTRSSKPFDSGTFATYERTTEGSDA